MKPLYLTYTNGVELYVNMAQRLCRQIVDLEAGDCFHLCLNENGRNRDFFAECFMALYPKITQSINDRPIIVLDADNELKKPIIELFESDWDIAACYRQPISNEYGQQDYCNGVVMLNNKRPNTIRKFWAELIYRTLDITRQCSSCPTTLKDRGWLDTWWGDQAALNEIILPPSNEVKVGKIYETRGYKILPLKRSLYGTKHRNKNAFIIHHKGEKKRR